MLLKYVSNRLLSLTSALLQHVGSFSLIRKMIHHHSNEQFAYKCTVYANYKSADELRISIVQIMYLHEYCLHLNKQQTFCLVGFSVVCLDFFEASVSACLPSTLLVQLYSSWNPPK